ncbi:MAG: hypothetical protein J2P41_04690, partial [Blastocatellia bacterium]|nr:hypothetical protein [Blastocatellia bacterium]
SERRVVAYRLTRRSIEDAKPRFLSTSTGSVSDLDQINCRVIEAQVAYAAYAPRTASPAEQL